MAESKKALVAGAGPGGLVAGLALRRHGYQITIYERSSSDRVCADVGGVYDLSPHTLQALDELGVGHDVRGRATTLSELVTYRDDGTKIGTLRTPTKLDIASIRRSELQRALVAKLGADELVADAEVAGFEQDARGVVLRLADGRTARGDVLIGADGVRSAVRTGVLGDRPPRFCECMCCWGRATVSDDRALAAIADTQAISWIGGGAVLVAARAGDLVVWSAFWHADRYERAPRAEATKTKVVDRFATFPELARRLLALTDPEVLAEVGIWDRDADERWSRGRVALIGDAAHPMTPFLGQGANSAIIDGYVLAHFLGQGAIEEAFARYEARRMKGVARNVASARRICTMMTGNRWWSGLASRIVFGWLPDRLMETAILDADRVNDIGDLVAEQAVRAPRNTHSTEPTA